MTSRQMRKRGKSIRPFFKAIQTESLLVSLQLYEK